MPTAKELYVRHALPLSAVALAAVIVLTSCASDQKPAGSAAATGDIHIAHLTVPSGTSIEVVVNTTISSEHAHVGDVWGGSVITGHERIPAGSAVSGTVTEVKPARKGDRAMLALGLSSITVDGHSNPAQGSTEPIIAGSTRARNLGAIAGSAAAGALVGKAVSGTGEGAAVGAMVGAGVATGVVAASDGYQIVLKSGTPLTFTTSEAMAVRQ
jgi:hypothetical protein